MRTIALALTVLGAAFAVGPGAEGGHLTLGQRWFIGLLPLFIFSLLMLGINRMTELLAMGSVRLWHEERVNGVNGEEMVLPWEARVSIIERCDPSGYVIFTVVPIVALVGSMVPSSVVAWDASRVLGVLALSLFIGMLALVALGLSYMIKSPKRAYDLANGKTILFRHLPFTPPQNPPTATKSSGSASTDDGDSAGETGRPLE